MKTLLMFGLMALMTSGSVEGDSEQAAPTPTPSAQIDVLPSPAKVDLIRRFLSAIGRQAQIDTGSFLQRYAMPGGAMWQVTVGAPLTENLRDGFDRRHAALLNAYARHRAEYQQAYESHVNWEFTEDELREIVDFLERPVGRHFLDGRWRMEAYVGSDMEGIEEQIVSEAIATLSQ